MKTHLAELSGVVTLFLRGCRTWASKGKDGLGMCVCGGDFLQKAPPPRWGELKKNLHTVWKGKLEYSRRLLVETLLCGSLAVT